MLGQSATEGVMADACLTVWYENVGAAALLTIDRPNARNAIDVATADALLTAAPRRKERLEMDDRPEAAPRA
jgi:enoyl-CoA hydratase/carnithine racemase